MKYYYTAPPAALRGLVGSIYVMETPTRVSDLVRVEIPHIRFLCRGSSLLSHGTESGVFEAPDAVVCGPSFRTGIANVSAGSMILGASLTPAGWHTLLGVPAEDFANRKQSIRDIRGDLDFETLSRVLCDGGSDETLLAAVADFLTAAIRPDAAPRGDFLTPAMDWASDPDSPDVEDLVTRTGLSARQVDRLCRLYFGGSPKQVHRVFRALNIAHRLTVDAAADWRDVVGPYYDQSHFIRDFRDRIGCTPNAFVRERRMMMRFDVELRTKVEGLSRYCLIG